jgi:sec-independent protein translocase protein TatA
MVDMAHAGRIREGRGRPNWLFWTPPWQYVVSTRFPAAVEWRECMGLAMSVPQLLIILVIVALIFGTKRLKEVGGDLGSAVKSFRKAMNTSAEAEAEASESPKQLTRDEEKQ